MKIRRIGPPEDYGYEPPSGTRYLFMDINNFDHYCYNPTRHRQLEDCASGRRFNNDYRVSALADHYYVHTSIIGQITNYLSEHEAHGAANVIEHSEAARLSESRQLRRYK